MTRIIIIPEGGFMSSGHSSHGYTGRRAFLLGSAAVAAGSLSTAQAQTPSSRIRNTRVSLAAYSHREALTSGQMDLFRFIDWSAGLNVSGVELTAYYFKEGFDRAYLRELRRRAFEQGLTVSGTAIRNNFCLPPGAERQKEIDGVRRWIDHAAELWAPHIRMFAGEIPAGADKKTAIGYVADCIRTVLDHAADRGIILGLENHHGITDRAADHLAICDAVGEHPWFGVNLDTGNYYTNPYQELEIAAPRAVNVQIKVEVMGENGIKKLADLELLRSILIKSKYKGWVALEYEADGDPFLEIPQYIREMKRLFES